MALIRTSVRPVETGSPPAVRAVESVSMPPTTVGDSDLAAARELWVQRLDRSAESCFVFGDLISPARGRDQPTDRHPPPLAQGCL